ncbi:MAG: ATP-binding cassette domain-containing protein [Clostridia bacterium]|nr:ATP-binding cassette domain-containing protein [Clostridia bacterium]
MSKQTANTLALEMLHISKRFSDSFGIADFNLRLEKGTIHGVLGERQSGKTVLARMLNGMCAPDSGSVLIEGEKVQLRNPRSAAVWGIGCAGEESPYVAGMSLIDHLLLGSEFAPSGKLHKRDVRKQAAEVCKRYEIPLDLSSRADDMTRAEWLWVEVLRMILQEKDILVLDEPDAVFTRQEMDQLADVLRKVCKNGAAALLLSQCPETVLSVCGQVTVLRAGMPAETYLASEAEPEDFARLIRGSEPVSAEKKEVSLGRMTLEVRRLTVRGEGNAADPAHELSFEVRAGEIVCLLGRPDHGWEALAAALIGAREPADGRIKLEGKDVTGASVQERLQAGVAYLPYNIRKLSAAGECTLEENLGLNRYREFQESGWVIRRRRRENAAHILETAGLSDQAAPDCLPDGMEEETLRLAMLSRELERKPPLLIVEEPTRHVSERTAEIIRERLFSVRANRRAVLLLTSQAEEAMRLADRILVMHEGEIMGEFDPAYSSVRELGWYMSGQWRQQRYGGRAIEGEDE